MLLYPVFSLALGVAHLGNGEVSVPRWQPHDFTFEGTTTHENPFQVPFSATVTGPNGTTFTTLGFYDGDGLWKIRLAPHTEGRWSLQTHSTDPMLDGKTAALLCVPNANPNVHGGLRIDASHPYHFVFEDGTRYFLVGYECDWLWALDMEASEPTALHSFLDTLMAHGFNQIILNAYAHDTGWRKGKTGDDDYGPPPMYAWEGTNESPDHTRFNLRYWQHFDRVMSALYERGVIAHMMIKVYNKMVNWPKNGGDEDDLYFKWLIARYAPYPNLVWDFSKEAHNEKDQAYKLSRFRLIREHDPYRRLITNHDDDRAYDEGAYNDLLDFRSDQHHRNWREKILEQRQQRTWPVVNVEFGYEHGPGGEDDKTYRVAQSPEEVVRRAWEICMAGGYIAYYYTYTAWDVIRPADVPPGYAYFKNLRDFFEQTAYWQMQPAADMVTEGVCLANPDGEYVVFLDSPKPFTVRIGRLLPARWFHPHTGHYSDAGTLSQGQNQLAPPGNWGDAPVVLHVGHAH